MSNNEPKYQICARCGSKKIASTEFFRRQKSKKNGLAGVCKKCKHEEYLKNRENILYKQKEYYSQPGIKEKRSEYHKKWAEKNKNILKEYQKEYRISNIEKLKEYKIKNREKILMQQHIWNLKNKKKYYYENRTKYLQQNKNWELKNKEKVRIKHQRRRALKNNLLANFSELDWEFVKNYFDNRCVYCGKKLPLEKEHFIPITKGGDFTKKNIICACRHCNASKSNKNFFEWYPSQSFFSYDRQEKILRYLKEL